MSKRATDAAWVLYPDYPSMDGGYVSQRNKRTLVMQGYEFAEKDLGWHPASEHPPVDEVVIALTNEHNGIKWPEADYICCAHIVDKSICKDFNGWNIPGVKYWMPMPKLPEEK